MHACNATSLDQLLSLRDGEPVDALAATHVSECADCAREVERLRTLKTALQSLPALTPPSYDALYKTQYDAAKLQARSRAAGLRRSAGLAAAAGLGALTLALIVAVNDSATVEMQNDAAAHLASAYEAPPQTVRPLVIRSQELEAALQRLPPRPQVERAGTVAAIESLESGIQWVDFQLSLADDAGLSESQSAQLWEQRVELMDSLVKVRFAEAQRAGMLVGFSGSSL